MWIQIGCETLCKKKKKKKKKKKTKKKKKKKKKAIRYKKIDLPPNVLLYCGLS